MLCANLFIEKIMKINNQNWYSLEIFGSQQDREIFITYIEDIIAGVNDDETYLEERMNGYVLS